MERRLGPLPDMKTINPLPLCTYRNVDVSHDATKGDRGVYLFELHGLSFWVNSHSAVAELDQAYAHGGTKTLVETFLTRILPAQLLLQPDFLLDWLAEIKATAYQQGFEAAVKGTTP